MKKVKKSKSFQPMTRAKLREMTPEQALTRLEKGNKEFIKNDGQPTKRDFGKYLNVTANYGNVEGGQHPFAIVLSCVDSRIPTEMIFDQYIGDIFNARIAGNFVNKDILGSMEFACGRTGRREKPGKTTEESIGAKLILVLGHTSCGAIAAACGAVRARDAGTQDNTTPPNLARLVGKLIPSVDMTPANNDEGKFVNDVAENNVRRTMSEILRRSTLLRGLVVNRKIQVRGAMYDVKTGNVRFL